MYSDFLFILLLCYIILGCALDDTVHLMTLSVNASLHKDAFILEENGQVFILIFMGIQQTVLKYKSKGIKVTYSSLRQNVFINNSKYCLSSKTKKYSELDHPSR